MSNDMSTDLSTSNTLADLAARIRAEHAGARAAMKRGIEHALAAGDLLIEAKQQVPHGQWLPWLNEHCDLAERTAQAYMRLARNRDALEAKSAAVADLTVRGAIDLLSPPAADELETAPVYAPRPPEQGEREIPIGDVKFGRDLYPRSTFLPHLVARYLEFLPALPPIEVNQRNELIDGWHRLEAHKKAGVSTIRVIVTEVADRVDHLMKACERNATHGLQLPLEVEREHRGQHFPVQRPESQMVESDAGKPDEVERQTSIASSSVKRASTRVLPPPGCAEIKADTDPREAAIAEGKRIADRLRAGSVRLLEAVEQFLTIRRDLGKQVNELSARERAEFFRGLPNIQERKNVRLWCRWANEEDTFRYAVRRAQLETDAIAWGCD